MRLKGAFCFCFNQVSLEISYNYIPDQTEKLFAAASNKDISINDLKTLNVKSQLVFYILMQTKKPA